MIVLFMYICIFSINDSIVYVYVYSLTFLGTIPDALGLLTKLTYLDVHGSTWTGKIMGY